MVVTSMVAVSAQAALTITWGAVESGGYLYDSSNAQLVSAGGYRVELILDKEKDTVIADMLSAKRFGIGAESTYGGAYNSDLVDDDEVLAFGIWQIGSTAGNYLAGNPIVPAVDIFTQYVSSTADGNGTDPFYVRWFNTGDGAVGSEVGIIYGTSGWVTASGSGDPQASVDFTYGGSGSATTAGTEYTAGSNDGWATVAAVPEPGTMALFAIGLVTMAVRRRRR